MKGSDVVAQFLKEKGIKYVFGVQGGAVVHLFDSCERTGPKPIFCHHEQGAAFASGAYARVHGVGACIVTTGPGATNAITPLLGAWQDSIPVLFISGQARVSQMSYGTQMRQIGSQEAPIVNLVHPITKLAGVVTTKGAIENALKMSWEAMHEGRKGPAWIDFPVDLQWA